METFEREWQMKLQLADLVLEITRKCNMHCPHCLRGPAQPVEMSTDIINRVTTEVDWISNLTLTGGEPSLGARVLEHLRWAMYFHNCHLDRFWLTVNARFFKQDFYRALLELYYLCSNQDDCCLTISGDQYHGFQSQVALDRYRELPFFSTEKMHSIEDDYLVNEGWARKNQMGRKEVSVPTEIYEYLLDDDSLYIDDMIYINAKGDVLLSCDLSYSSQKKCSLGNILHEPLVDILTRNLARVTQTESA